MNSDCKVEGPLSGLRIIDLSRLLPGPFCTWYLSALGAEVVRVERPQGGEPSRSIPPFVDGKGVFHAALNRGKASVALDTRQPEGQAALLALLEGADVLVESFRPGVLGASGIDLDGLCRRLPRLIVASITGYGQDGPLASDPGHDLNFAGYSGIVAATEGLAPHPVQIADLGGGALSACLSIVAALYGRERTGKGARLDISMTDGALALMGPHLATAQAEGRDFRPGQEPLTGGMANYRSYRCRDGKILCFAPLEPKFWDGVSQAIEEPIVPESGALEALFLRRDRAEWLGLFKGLCVTPALTVEEIFEELHFQARGCFEEVLGLKMVRAPFPYRTASHVPALGEDTERILGELDINLDELYRRGLAFQKESEK